MVAASDEITESQAEWLRVRRFLAENRQHLTEVLAREHSADDRVAGTHLIGKPEWFPAEPYPLERLALTWTPAMQYQGVAGTEPQARQVWPLRADGRRFATYSDAIRGLCPPRIFDDKPTYRLRLARLAGLEPELTFSRGSYFDGVNVGDAYAHEFAAYTLGLVKEPTFRQLIGDIRNLDGRPVNAAISCLTLRHDRKSGRTSFPLHWRDPAKVANSGGLTHVIPVGVFQALSGDPWNESEDFSLWRCLLREYAEEMLGRDEDYAATESAFDYSNWEFGQQLEQARTAGQAHVWILGMGVDPLTMATDLLVVAVFESHAYDDIFGKIVSDNDEGKVVVGPDSQLFPFTETGINDLVGGGQMQAAGAAVLRLAWQHAPLLLGSP